MCSNGERNGFCCRRLAFLAKLARYPLRTKERSSEADTTMGWHLTAMETSYLNSLTDMRNAFSCTKSETSEAPRIFSWSFDKTFKRWKLNHQTPPHMMLAALFAGTRGTKADGPWSGFADDLFIKDVLPDHTAYSAKDVILNNAASLDNTLAEDRYKQNLRKEQDTSEEDTLSTAATQRK